MNTTVEIPQVQSVPSCESWNSLSIRTIILEDDIGIVEVHHHYKKFEVTSVDKGVARMLSDTPHIKTP
jgi:hypothetical protein